MSKPCPATSGSAKREARRRRSLANPPATIDAMTKEHNQLRECNAVCMHDVPLANYCQSCEIAAGHGLTREDYAAIDRALHPEDMEEIGATGRLFATAAELGLPPVAHGDADLSRIRVTMPASMEEYDRLHAEMETARAERKAKHDRINGAFDMTKMGAL